MTHDHLLLPGLLLLAGLALVSIAVAPSFRRNIIATKLRLHVLPPHIRDSRTAVKRSIGTFTFLDRLRDGEGIWAMMLLGLLGTVLIQLAPINQWGIVPRVTLVMMTLYLGYRIPHMRRAREIEHYRIEIERDLPAMIDLLVVMLDAGSTFDQAIATIVRDKKIPDTAIKKEFARLNAELSITPQRPIAFQKFASSAALGDLRLLTSVLIQSENFGTPISKGLRSLAAEIRERQFHALEARGSALGPKLAVPMTFFFLPLIFIVVLTPTIIRALHLS